MERCYDDYKKMIDEHLLDFLPNIDNKSISLYESMKLSLIHILIGVRISR